jgi:choline dehydrogenase-like flavoprotein
MIIGRVANLTVPHNDRINCQYRNKCLLGCPFGAYFSTQSATLPAAMSTGNLTLRPFSIVTRVLYDKDSRKARGVEVLDAETHQTYEFRSKIVFLCASALNSSWVLMNSATDVWPGGLGSSSGELGHNIMDHQSRSGASGKIEGFEDRYIYGRRPNVFYIPRFRNLSGERRDYLRGFGYQGSASRESWSREIPELGIGAPLKDALSEPGGWTMGMSGYGEILPRHSNRVYLDHETKDKWAATSWTTPSKCSKPPERKTRGHFKGTTRLASAFTRWAVREWAAIPRPPCSTPTIRSGTQKTFLSPTARA